MSDREIFYYQCHVCGIEGLSYLKQKHVCDQHLQEGHEDAVSCKKCLESFFKELREQNV